ncbi:hypothetical protein BN1708_020220, partial [Verticillium longisporum]
DLCHLRHSLPLLHRLSHRLF